MPRPLSSSPDEIVHVERRLAEEMLAALAAQLEQRALDRPDRLFGDVAVGGRQFLRAARAIDQHRLQVVEVEQQQPVLVCDVEGDRQHAFLHLVQVHQPRQQQRPHLADGGADRMALLAEQIPELHGRVGIGPGRIPDFGGARGEGGVGLCGGGARHREARQIALHVGDEARDARLRQALDQALDRYGLAGAGCARDQAVAVGALEVELLGLGAARAGADENATWGNRGVGHYRASRARCLRAKLLREIGGGGRKIPLPRWGERDVRLTS